MAALDRASGEVLADAPVLEHVLLRYPVGQCFRTKGTIVAADVPQLVLPKNPRRIWLSLWNLAVVYGGDAPADAFGAESLLYDFDDPGFLVASPPAPFGQVQPQDAATFDADRSFFPQGDVFLMAHTPGHPWAIRWAIMPVDMPHPTLTGWPVGSAGAATGH